MARGHETMEPTPILHKPSMSPFYLYFRLKTRKIYLMKREPSSFIKDYVIFEYSKKCFDSQYNLRISK